MKIKRKISAENTLRFQEQTRFYLNEITPTLLSHVERNSTTGI